jgi:tetratricopeptide (TPR) repeat protein
MSHTLNLIDHLLALGRRYQELGRLRDAVQVLSRLSAFRDLPGEAAEEAQARLAELHLKRRRYQLARRCLTAALTRRPDEARYHRLMATAVLAEDRGDLDRAADHYRRAVDLDGDDAVCLAEYGVLTVRLGRTDEGLARLRRAVERAPDDPEVVGKAAKGLRLAGRPDEARDLLRAALFRNPRAPRFRKLWAELQYQQLRRRQQHGGRGRAAGPADDGPVLLPFAPAPPQTAPATPGARSDGPAPPAPPHRCGGNPKSETRNPKQIRNPKSEIRNQCE